MELNIALIRKMWVLLDIYILVFGDQNNSYLFGFNANKK